MATVTNSKVFTIMREGKAGYWLPITQHDYPTGTYASYTMLWGDLFQGHKISRIVENLF